MSLVLAHAGRRRVIRVGRFAGQYAKPRSADMETRDGVELPSYRGDNVNAPEFDAAARTPDPQRMVTGHARSALTLNFIRSLVDGGFADLHHPEYWDLDFVRRVGERVPADGRVDRRGASLHGIAGGGPDRGPHPGRLLHQPRAALLEYEAALPGRCRTARAGESGDPPPLDRRTADPGGGHVAFMRGIRNPVAVKIARR